MELAYHQDVKNRPPFSDIAQALNEMRIQHHQSKHGSVSLSSSSQRFHSRTASITSLISRADSTEDPCSVRTVANLYLYINVVLKTTVQCSCHWVVVLPHHRPRRIISFLS